MPMNFEIRMEKQTSLSQEEVSIIQALDILQTTCKNHGDKCGSDCPLWSIDNGECVFFSCANPTEFSINPRKVFHAVD